MLLRDEEAGEFQRAYKEDTGEEVTVDEAREMASRMLELFLLLSQPLPREIEERTRRIEATPPSEENPYPRP